MGVDKLLCLITGPSGSGKSSIALELQKRLSMATTTVATTVDDESKPQNIERENAGNQSSSSTKAVPEHPLSVAVIHQDQYFTKDFLPYRERVDDSFENGSGIDWGRLVADVQSALSESTRKREDEGNENKSSGAGLTIVIVEGHLLGDAAALFRQRFFSRENIGILGVFLGGCSQDSCKRRRLERKKNRSDDERKELAEYIDAFVWPSFLAYGAGAMDALRRDLGGAANKACSKAAKSIDKDTSDSKLNVEIRTKDTTTSTMAFVLEIDNSEGASLGENVDEISNRVYNILSNR